MKTIVFSTLLAASSVTVAADTQTKHHPLTEEQKSERRAIMAARRAAKIAAAGGMVTKPHEGNFARVVSAQNTVTLDFLKEVVTQFNSGLFMQIEVSAIESGSDVWETLRKAKELPETGLVTLVVDDKKLPRIVSALEDGWAILNVHDLGSDLPPKKVYDERVRKEVNRAFAQAAGAGLSYNRPCVMEPAFSLRDIDRIQFPVISPEAMSKIQDAGAKRNIGRIMTKTYKTACEEGWAPPPTNDVQRAIWDKVHAIPKAPMKIEFDPKKGR